MSRWKGYQKQHLSILRQCRLYWAEELIKRVALLGRRAPVCYQCISRPHGMASSNLIVIYPLHTMLRREGGRPCTLAGIWLSDQGEG